MANLFGEAGKQPQAAAQPKEQPAEGQPKPSASPPSTDTVQQLIIKAIQEFEEYQRLTSQGKLGEAGQKLEQHKRTLEELKKVGTRQ